MNPEINYEVLDIANEEQKQLIKELDELKIGASQKADVILVILGVKPATEFELYPWAPAGSNQKALEVLDKAKLHYKLKKQNNLPEGAHYEYAVARNSEDLKKLLVADSSQDHAIYGKLMGYPESAVQAFLNKDRYENTAKDKFPISFALSKTNHANEMKLIQYWNRLIEKYAPKTYKDLIPS